MSDFYNSSIVLGSTELVVFLKLKLILLITQLRTILNIIVSDSSGYVPFSMREVNYFRHFTMLRPDLTTFR